MPISFEPMRNYMKEHNISYYFLANEGMEAGTLQRLRSDGNVTTNTIGKLCKIMNCKPEDLICYLPDKE